MLNICVDNQEGFKYAHYATVCIVCLSRITECTLQKCSGCKLVFYCSKDHQKMHWPKHKKLCRAVQEMIKKTGSVGLFDDYHDEGFKQWIFFRESLRSICEHLMKTKLTRDESGLLMNPFVCKLCHNHNTNHMITCVDCCVVSYCSKEHQQQDKAKHNLVCRDLKLCLDFDTNCNKRFSLKASIADISVLPTDMQIFITDFVNMKSEPHIDDVYIGCHISNVISIPLTLIYAISKSNKHIGKEALTIHVAGSGSYESSAWWSWEYIFHYFKSILSINIAFIGPESLNQFLPPVLLCADCQRSRSFNFSVNSNLYHNYVKATTAAPDVIVAFNCGFHERNTEYSWKDSMAALCSFPNSVVLFTSYVKDESLEDLRVLKEFSKCDFNILIQCERNPFRSLTPFHDWYNEEGSVFYNNNFITVLKT